MFYHVGRDFLLAHRMKGLYFPKSTFYHTTAIDYPNAEPHVGHSLEISVDSWTRTTVPRHFRTSTELFELAMRSGHFYLRGHFRIASPRINDSGVGVDLIGPHVLRRV